MCDDRLHNAFKKQKKVMSLRLPVNDCVMVTDLDITKSYDFNMAQGDSNKGVRNFQYLINDRRLRNAVNQFLKSPVWEIRTPGSVGFLATNYPEEGASHPLRLDFLVTV